jgi:hypothetical protein
MGKGVADFSNEMRARATESVQRQSESSATVLAPESFLHLLAYPIRDQDGSIRGALVVVHDASHLEERQSRRRMQFAIWIMGSTALLLLLVVGATWLMYDRPLRNLAEWMRRLRTGDVAEAPPVGLPVALWRGKDRLAARSAPPAAGGLESRETVREHKV